MSRTGEKTEQKTKGEFLPAEPTKKPRRMSPGSLDEAYITAFLENPHLGKTAAYRVATGIKGEHCRQRAYDLHRRLQNLINEQLRDRALGAVSYGLDILFNLARNSESENVRAACASKLVDFGLKFSPPETLQARPLRTREELEESIW